MTTGSEGKSGKPRAKFCWECGLQLRQRKIFVEIEVEGHKRILHKQCAKKIKNGDRTEYTCKGEILDEIENDL